MSASVIPAPGTSGTARASERVMSRVELTTSARLCVFGSARGLGGSSSKGFRIRSRWRVCKRCKRGLAVLLTISAARSFGSVGSGGRPSKVRRLSRRVGGLEGGGGDGVRLRT